jgi:hypothetical protein
VFAIGLKNSAPTVAILLADRLPDLTGSTSQVDVTYRTDESGMECVELKSGIFAQSTKPQLPRPFVLGNSGEVAFVVTNIRCTVETTQGRPEPVSSRYVASYLQEQNPRYVQLQTDLQAAVVRLAQLKQEHALNPPNNVFSGIAYGLAEGTAQNAINNIQKQLSDTGPFLSRPVELEYSPSKVRVTRVATVAVSLSATDSQSGFGDSLELSASANNSDDMMQGVNDNDSQHLRNRLPVLTSPSELVVKALGQLTSSVSGATKQLGQRLFIARAASSFNARRPAVQSLGNILRSSSLCMHRKVTQIA